MRPDRFTQLLIAAAGTLDGVTATPAPETDGRRKRPHLVQVQADGKTSRWQIVAASAPGDRYDQPEPEPILGDKPAAPAVEGPPGTPEYLEAALVAVVVAADPGEIAAVDLYSRREEPPAVGHGATIGFHDGSRIYLNRA
jgi:hypothetical protein